MIKKVGLMLLPTLLLLASASRAQTGYATDQVWNSQIGDYGSEFAPQDYLASPSGVHGWQGDVFSYYNYQGKTYRPYRYYYPRGIWYPYYYRYGYYPYSYRYYWYPYSYNGGHWWSW